MHRIAALAIGVWMAAAPRPCAAEKPPVPDLTRGGQPDQTHDWTLGPTGARGWLWGWQGHTTDARQIRVTDVAKGSPADGVLAKGDVLLGVNGKPFADDARILFARAVTEAEREKSGGVLRLLRWREGRTESVQVKLPVMGTYSDAAPYDCPKTKRVFELACQAIARKGMDRVSIPNDMNALALVASGRPEYKQMVAKYARTVAAHQPGGHVTWGYAYATLFLAEYALATRDEAVMPGLRRLALDIARGQSGVGTWGHAFARTDGILNGYGAMNQPGIVLTIAMTLSREAGVKEADLDRAIDRAARFLRWYVNKGAIPYGDHDPWPWHDDNGKCSSAAVLFDLLGDREAASFFARMATAAHAERESGHTGNFFNVLWALPGVSRCGPLAVAAYLEEQAWYCDLARGWDGTVLYQGTPGNWGGHQYRGWDCTGAFLLGYALPLKSLYLTGKKPCAVPALSRAEAAEVIAAGRDFTYWAQTTCYDGRDTEALFAGLASWSPAVRKRSAQAMSRREGDFVPRLLKLLGSKDQNARYGAIEAIGLLGPRADAAGPQVRALLDESDPWLLCLAAEALARMGPEVGKAAVPELLRLTVRENPADPRRRVQRAVCVALFSPMPGRHEPKSILADSLEGVDRELLYPAVRAALENEDGATRGLLRTVYGKLGDRDVVALLPAIVKAIQRPSPSGEMFADGIRLAGLDLLSRLRIREGMAMCVELMEPDRWGQGRRIPTCLSYLARYGGNAKPLIPQLKDVREAIAKRDRKSETVPAIDKAIAKIEADRTPPSLLGLKEFATTPTRP
ncbi:MAG TPA: DUF6288 domain-containing protein [Planctomycetota bacterium]|nr:DUF6288 domain-containing protein [Planctomycetota bacterium]